ncbi:MAG TPA: C-type lectin domain-containing protein [Polyangiaceae bacterium]|nr:C-type lectin domain-containing protein [Polyangiaceae bacterium]
MSGELTSASARGATRPWTRALWAAAFALMLPGCPLSDEYYVVEAAAGRGSGGTATDPPGGRGPAPGAGGRQAMTMPAGAQNAPTAGSGPVGCESHAELCDGISNDCDDEIDEDGACPSGCTGRTFGGHVYLLCLPAQADQMTHIASNDACLSYSTLVGAPAQSMELVAIESAEENTFLKAWLAEAVTDQGIVWTSAMDLLHEGNWIWGHTQAAPQFFTQSPDGGGKPFMDRFNDFAGARPDGTAKNEQDCGDLDASLDWQWDDTACMEPGMGFLCEGAPETSPK